MHACVCCPLYKFIGLKGRPLHPTHLITARALAEGEGRGLINTELLFLHLHDVGIISTSGILKCGDR